MKLFKSWTFTWQEMAGIKLTLLSIGILLALNYPVFFSNLMWLWWAIVIIGAVFYLARCLKVK